jgi:hypothetical protein
MSGSRYLPGQRCTGSGAKYVSPVAFASTNASTDLKRNRTIRRCDKVGIGRTSTWPSAYSTRRLVGSSR